MMLTEPSEKMRQELRRPGLAWRVNARHEAPAEQLKWLPVAKFDTARLELGLSSDGLWVVPGPSSATEFRPGSPCVFLLPLLEVSFDEVRRTLVERLTMLQLSTDFVSLLPVEFIVATALESHSGYWIKLGLQWAEKMLDSEDVRSALGRLVSGTAPQGLRHAARKLLRASGASRTPRR